MKKLLSFITFALLLVSCKTATSSTPELSSSEVSSTTVSSSESINSTVSSSSVSSSSSSTSSESSSSVLPTEFEVTFNVTIPKELSSETFLYIKGDNYYNPNKVSHKLNKVSALTWTTTLGFSQIVGPYNYNYVLGDVTSDLGNNYLETRQERSITIGPSNSTVTDTITAFNNIPATTYYDLTFQVSIPEELPARLFIYLVGNHTELSSLNMYKMNKISALEWQVELNHILEGSFSYKYAVGEEDAERNTEYEETGEARVINIETSRQFNDTVSSFKNIPELLYDITINITFDKRLTSDFIIYLVGDFPDATWISGNALYAFPHSINNEATLHLQLPAGVYEYLYNVSDTLEADSFNWEVHSNNRTLTVSDDVIINDTISGWENPTISQVLSTLQINATVPAVPEYASVYMFGDFIDGTDLEGEYIKLNVSNSQRTEWSLETSIRLGFYTYQFVLGTEEEISLANIEVGDVRTLDVLTSLTTVFPIVNEWTNIPTDPNATYEITFIVDTPFVPTWASVFITGTMQEETWLANDSNYELTPNEARTRWTISKELKKGLYEYKYTLGSWTFSEDRENNRNIIVSEEAIIDDEVTSWKALPPNPDPVAVTFVLQTPIIPLWAEVYIAGNFEGESWTDPNANVLTPNEARTEWTTTLQLLSNSYEYKYTLGSWSYVEDIAEPRTITVSEATIHNDTVNNFIAFPPDPDLLPLSVTFVVSTPIVPSYLNVYLAGSFNEWQTKENDYLLLPNETRTQWSLTTDIIPGSYEYKYHISNGLDIAWANGANLSITVNNETVPTTDTVSSWTATLSNPDYGWYLVGAGSFINGDEWSISGGIRFTVNTAYEGDGVEYMLINQEFITGDVFKFTDNNEPQTWIDSGWDFGSGSAFANNYMSIVDGNVLVNETGLYDIYFKVYTNSTYSCWISKV
ncbi:MAG: hypothetical protein LBM99_00915 [Bacillales bacterium]|jgi:hypothetical protein|nr:hypothetical protein [Bacillales bacterium]